jgi:hypothetical protein
LFDALRDDPWWAWFLFHYQDEVVVSAEPTLPMELELKGPGMCIERALYDFDREGARLSGQLVHQIPLACDHLRRCGLARVQAWVLLRVQQKVYQVLLRVLDDVLIKNSLADGGTRLAHRGTGSRRPWHIQYVGAALSRRWHNRL